MSFSDLCWTDLQISNLKPVIIKILVLQGLKTWQFITFILRKCSWHIKHSQYRTAISSCTHPKRGRSQDLCFQGMLKTLSLPPALHQNQGGSGSPASCFGVMLPWAPQRLGHSSVLQPGMFVAEGFLPSHPSQPPSFLPASKVRLSLAVSLILVWVWLFKNSLLPILKKKKTQGKKNHEKPQPP